MLSFESMLSITSLSDGFAASAIEKTDEWIITSSGVETSISNVYDKELIMKKQQVISTEISKICGKPMSFLVNLVEKKEIPEQVKILLDAFKGTIVTGKA